MKAAFMWTPATGKEIGDATASHGGLPRTKRKTLRYVVPKAIPITKTNIDADQVVTDWLAIHDPLNDRDYYTLNTCDPDFNIDEFGDIDNEYEGLTIVAMGKDTRRWLKGYNIL